MTYSITYLFIYIFMIKLKSFSNISAIKRTNKHNIINNIYFIYNLLQSLVQ